MNSSSHKSFIEESDSVISAYAALIPRATSRTCAFTILSMRAHLQVRECGCCIFSSTVVADCASMPYTIHSALRCLEKTTVCLSCHPHWHVYSIDLSETRQPLYIAPTYAAHLHMQVHKLVRMPACWRTYRQTRL